MKENKILGVDCSNGQDSFETAIIALKKNINSLSKKINDCEKNNDYRSCIDMTRLMKDSMNLVKDFDWKYQYEEIRENDRMFIKTYEQNYNGNIRNLNIIDILELSNNINTSNNIDLRFFDFDKTFINPFNGKQTEISDRFQFKYFNFREKLKKSIENKETNIIYTGYDELYRGIGKSSIMLNLSLEFNLPLLTGGRLEIYENENGILKKYKNNKYPIYYYNSLKGRYKTGDIILLDEPILHDKEKILNLPYTFIGFAMGEDLNKK